MARLQTYGKVRKRHIKPSFDFSSPEKDQTETSREEEIIEITCNLKKLELSREDLGKKHRPQLRQETVLLPIAANTSLREAQCEESKDGQSSPSFDEDKDSLSSPKRVNIQNEQTSRDNGGQQTNQKTGYKGRNGQNARSAKAIAERKEELQRDQKEKQSLQTSARKMVSRPLSKGRTVDAEPTEPLKRSEICEKDQTKTHLSSSPSVSIDALCRGDVPSEVQPLAIHANEVLSFSAFADSISDFQLSKIAEASYSEVYRLTAPPKSTQPIRKRRSPKNTSTTTPQTTEAVLKLIPLKPPPPPPRARSKPGSKSKSKSKPTPQHATEPPSPRTDFMTPPAAVISEIQLLRLLSPIPGFTMFRTLRLLHGRPPPLFRAAYRAHRVQKTGELRAAGHGADTIEREFGFPDPDDDGGAGYDAGQWWALLEMEDAGTDLEGCRVADVFAVWDVFWRVAIAVGKGEADVEFEHRDLHAGNVCVKARREDGDGGGGRDGAESRSPSVKCLGARKGVDLDRTLGFTDLEVTVIDYTNSRAILSAEEGEKGGVDEVAFKNLEEELEVFETPADLGYQYKIPRFMRDLVLKDGNADAPSLSSEKKGRTAMKREKPSWREYHPKTNLLWLHFLLKELMDWTEETREDTRRKLSAYEKKSDTRGRVHENSEEPYRRIRKELDLERTLLEVQSMLLPRSLLKSSLDGAGDLVNKAWQAKWLSEDDIKE